MFNAVTERTQLSLDDIERVYQRGLTSMINAVIRRAIPTHLREELVLVGLNKDLDQHKEVLRLELDSMLSYQRGITDKDVFRYIRGSIHEFLRNYGFSFTKKTNIVKREAASGIHLNEAGNYE